MKIINITRGFFVKVDDEDFDELNKYKWHAGRKGFGKFYACRSQRIDKKKIGIYMHRQLLAAVKGQEVDHIDGDPFNNQKLNLRLCSHSQNMANRSVSHRKKSNFRGIYKVGNKWAAKCYRKYLGIYISDVDAAKAFDKAAIIQFGEFAVLNFPKI